MCSTSIYCFSTLLLSVVFPELFAKPFVKFCLLEVNLIRYQTDSPLWRLEHSQRQAGHYLSHAYSAKSLHFCGQDTFL